MFVVIWSVFASAVVQPVHSNDTVRWTLTETLLKPYNKQYVPRDSNKTTVNVSMAIWPYDILYMNEAKSSIKISGWMDLRWKDSFLIWDPVEYDNISYIFIPADRLWMPSVDIYYSKEEGARPTICENCYAKVDHNGSVLRGYYFAYSFPCEINIKYFPFDSQICTMELANWYLDATMMDLYPFDSSGKEIDLSVFLPNEEWDLAYMKVTRNYGYFNYGNFASLMYKLKIVRKPFFYICNLVMPTFFLTVTAVIGYHMPDNGNGVHQEKVKMGLTTMLAVFILQLGVADKMPKTSNVVPLISIYYSCLVTLLSVAIVISSMIIIVEKQGQFGKPVPLWAQRYLLRGANPIPLKPERKNSRGLCVSKFASMLNCNCSQLKNARLCSHHSNGYISSGDNLMGPRLASHNCEEPAYATVHKCRGCPHSQNQNSLIQRSSQSSYDNCPTEIRGVGITKLPSSPDRHLNAGPSNLPESNRMAKSAKSRLLNMVDFGIFGSRSSNATYNSLSQLAVSPPPQGGHAVRKENDYDRVDNLQTSFRSNQLPVASQNAKPGAKQAEAEASANQKNENRNPDEVQDGLKRLSALVLLIESEITTKKHKNLIINQWRRLADVLERISLTIFLSLTLLTLIMFFNHGWY